MRCSLQSKHFILFLTLFHLIRVASQPTFFLRKQAPLCRYATFPLSGESPQGEGFCRYATFPLTEEFSQRGSIFFVYFLRKQQKNEVRNSLSGIDILLIINRSVGPCTKTSTLCSSCVRTKRLLLEEKLSRSDW